MTTQSLIAVLATKNIESVAPAINLMTKKFLIILLSLIMGFLIFPIQSRAVTVGPGKLEYSVDPGQIVSGQMFLMNETQSPATFYPSFEKFTEDNGEKIFTKEESDLSTWVKSSSSVALKPGESKNIPFTIEIPQDASPGGHFAVIWWSNAPPGQGVSIVTRAGILLMLRVSGDIKEEGRILSFDTDNLKRFFTSFPIPFSIVFKNDGNVYVKPSGKITIKNILGQTKASLPVNKFSLQILPNSKRTFGEQWESTKFAFGPYKVELSLVYGESKKEVSQSFWIWVITWKLIAAIIILLFIIFYVIPKSIKKYNRWIVEKYAKRD